MLLSSALFVLDQARTEKGAKNKSKGESATIPSFALLTLASLCAIMPQESSATSAKPLSIIVACASDGGIGKAGQLPWRLPGDMAYFKRITTETSASAAGEGAKLNAVIMGRKTWDSIPAKFRPLPGRVNVVLSRNPAALGLPADVLGATSLEDALAAVDNRADIEQCFCIGGAEIYKECFEHARLSKVCLATASCVLSAREHAFVLATAATLCAPACACAPVFHRRHDCM